MIDTRTRTSLIDPSSNGLAWLGIDPDSDIGVRINECGFDAFERDDGLHPDSARQRWSAYDDYLVANGFESDNPWGDFANSGLDENGDRLSGWLLKNSRLAANVPEEHSETAYMTDRGMEYERGQSTVIINHFPENLSHRRPVVGC